MVKHPSSRAERIKLKQIHEKKAVKGKRGRPQRERGNETDPEVDEGSL